MSNDPFRLPSASRRGFLGAAAALPLPVEASR